MSKTWTVVAILFSIAFAPSFAWSQKQESLCELELLKKHLSLKEDEALQNNKRYWDGRLFESVRGIIKEYRKLKHKPIGLNAWEKLMIAKSNGKNFSSVFLTDTDLNGVFSFMKLETELLLKELEDPSKFPKFERNDIKEIQKLALNILEKIEGDGIYTKIKNILSKSVKNTDQELQMTYRKAMEVVFSFTYLMDARDPRKNCYVKTKSDGQTIDIQVGSSAELLKSRKKFNKAVKEKLNNYFYSIEGFSILKNRTDRSIKKSPFLRIPVYSGDRMTSLDKYDFPLGMPYNPIEVISQNRLTDGYIYSSSRSLYHDDEIHLGMLNPANDPFISVSSTFYTHFVVENFERLERDMPGFRFLIEEAEKESSLVQEKIKDQIFDLSHETNIRFTYKNIMFLHTKNSREIINPTEDEMYFFKQEVFKKYFNNGFQYKFENEQALTSEDLHFIEKLPLAKYPIVYQKEDLSPFTRFKQLRGSWKLKLGKSYSDDSKNFEVVDLFSDQVGTLRLVVKNKDKDEYFVTARTFRFFETNDE